jgi:hypothetical protein
MSNEGANIIVINCMLHNTPLKWVHTLTRVDTRCSSRVSTYPSDVGTSYRYGHIYNGDVSTYLNDVGTSYRYGHI